jgi:hypothetical protein
MPVVFRYRDIVFSSSRTKDTHLNRCTSHVRRGEAAAKFWLSPQISVAESYGMNAAELRKLMRMAEKNKELIERYWNEHLNV